MPVVAMPPPELSVLVLKASMVSKLTPSPVELATSAVSSLAAVTNRATVVGTVGAIVTSPLVSTALPAMPAKEPPRLYWICVGDPPGVPPPPPAPLPRAILIIGVVAPNCRMLVTTPTG